MSMLLRSHRYLIVPMIFVLCFSRAEVVFAEPSFTAEPLVIDGKGKPREILHYSITIKNKEAHLITIYPWVTNFSSASGTLEMPDLSHADLSSSLANWIEVTRGAIDLLPGESRDIPVLIQINLTAKPGIYHAAIDFSSGPNRAEAEANTLATLAVPVNIEVEDDVKEKLQLANFVPDKNWFTGALAAFHYKIQNIGNRGLIPHGKIHIYDRRGEEVATIDANQNGERLEPNRDMLLAASWQSGDNFGKYKAMLDMEYGDVNRGTIQDTIFFWVVPWQKILGMFLSIAIASIIVAVLLHSRSEARRLSFARAKYIDLPEDEIVEESYFDDGDIGAAGGEIATRLKHVIMQRSATGNTLDTAVQLPSQENTRVSHQVYESVSLPDRPHVGGVTQSATEPVRLQPKQKSSPNPNHIISLK